MTVALALESLKKGIHGTTKSPVVIVTKPVSATTDVHELIEEVEDQLENLFMDITNRPRVLVQSEFIEKQLVGEDSISLTFRLEIYV